MAKKAPVAEAPTVTPVPRVQVFERDQIFQRRLENPFGDGSPTVRLKEAGWALHIFDTSRPGRFHYARREKGWEPVAPEELDGSANDYGFDVLDGKVVRGERGKEILMKMPQRMYDLIAQRKAEVTNARNSPARLKAEVMEQTAAQYSDQAASYLDRNVTIKDTRAPVPLEEPPNG
jgi:hypothetical protein